jgi:hypothetical protein
MCYRWQATDVAPRLGFHSIPFLISTIYSKNEKYLSQGFVLLLLETCWVVTRIVSGRLIENAIGGVALSWKGGSVQCHHSLPSHTHTAL